MSVYLQAGQLVSSLGYRFIRGRDLFALNSIRSIV